MEIKPLVRGCYDVQKLRIQFGNRICTAFKTKIGIKPRRQTTTISVINYKTTKEVNKEMMAAETLNNNNRRREWENDQI